MFMLPLTILFPVVLGTVLLALKEETVSAKAMRIYTGIVLGVELILIGVCVFGVSSEPINVFNLTSTLKVGFMLDNTGRIFASIIGIIWTCVGFYSFEYMKHEDHNKRYFGFYIIMLGILMGLCFSGNLLSYYAFYEFMTLCSFALVLHNQTREAIMASLKYMFYSFAGAYMVLFGLYFVYKYSNDKSMSFVEGGFVNTEAGTGILLVAMLLMIVGFGVKAGMFPLHGWLPTAHPVAPAPASAVLSGIIVKAGVLGVLRTIYYVFGVDFFNGSYVQKVVLIFALITVFMGSMLAYREPLLKKRLAFSTVSQVSYILMGLFMCTVDAYKGSILHVVSHAAIKSTLFVVAGAIIFKTGCTRVEELRGIGKKMPVMMWCYTIVSLGLIGIPPFGGFTSKWYLCLGALDSYIPVFSWLGPVILLVSALLTAGYLLPISINGFLPGNDFENKVSEEPENPLYKAYISASEPGLIMLIPMIIMTLVSVVVGLLPEVITWL